MRRILSALAFTGVVALPAPLLGQETGTFEVSTALGWQLFDDAAALDDAVVGSVEAVYGLTDMFGLGAYVQAGRPSTRGEYFPLVALPFSDSTFRYLPDQRTTQLGFGVVASARLPLGSRLHPYVVGGIGTTRFSMDPEQNRGNVAENFTTWTLGAGLEVRLSDAMGVRLDARDQIYTGFDRDVFDVGDPLYRDPVFPHPGGEIPEPSDTVHNLRLALAFSFVPGVEGR